MTKKETILNLLGEQGDIDAAFDELDKVFLHKNAKYMDYCREFQSPPNNFSKEEFRSRLKRFVSTDYIEPKVKNKKMEFDIYDLLCDIDFKPQSIYFKNGFHQKIVSAVLLHGENDEDGNDLKWLYHQLLKTESLMDEPPILIDFSGSTNFCFEDVFRNICLKLLPDKDERKKIVIDPFGNYQKPVIRNVIEDYLKTNNLVILIKHPKNVSELSVFYNSFNDLFSYLKKEILVSYNNSLIFLIVESNTEGYKEDLDESYFLWFEEKNKMMYSKTVKDCRDAKIIDLAPVQNIEALEIEDWINRNLEYDEVDKALSCYLGCAHYLLEGKSNRYHVIQKLFDKLKVDETKKPDQWLIY